MFVQRGKKKKKKTTIESLIKTIDTSHVQCRLLRVNGNNHMETRGRCLAGGLAGGLAG